MIIYSQRDPKYLHMPLPNASNPSYITVGNFGCLLSCLANLSQVPTEQILKEHPECFNSQGFMQTDKLYAYYGFKVRKEPHTPGTPMPVQNTPYIAVTSFYKKMNPDWGTHYYLRMPDNTSIDSSSAHNPKTVDRYESTCIEIRYVDKLDSAPTGVVNCTHCTLHNCPK